MTKQYFYVEELPSGTQWIVKVNTELIKVSGMTGSLHVLGARVCGIPYAEYLRYCRSKYRAELRGKIGYPYPIFYDKKNAEKLAKELSERFSSVIVI